MCYRYINNGYKESTVALETHMKKMYVVPLEEEQVQALKLLGFQVMEASSETLGDDYRVFTTSMWYCDLSVRSLNIIWKMMAGQSGEWVRRDEFLRSTSIAAAYQHYKLHKKQYQECRGCGPGVIHDIEQGFKQWGLV